jgi:hypothetical protein
VEAGNCPRTEAHHEVDRRDYADRLPASRPRSPVWLVAHTLVANEGCGGIRSRRLPDDLLDIEEQQFRCQYDSSGQRVISTGPYGIVRHPMYMGVDIWLLFTPLALGSYFALPAFLLLIPLVVLRLLNEEKVLRQELLGYSEYCLHTRFRLVPYLW